MNENLLKQTKALVAETNDVIANLNVIETKLTKLEKENRQLKNRCRVLSKGLLCGGCEFDCESRSEEYQGEAFWGKFILPEDDDDDK